MIDVMYSALYKPLIHWPDRDVLQQTLPMDFREHYPNCTVIIDCFEIDIERPTNLLARAQTFSSYEHHNTAKYLIGITPQGTVSYISCGWGGRVSDKHLPKNCDLMNFLLPGDTILADRGFDIQESHNKGQTVPYIYTSTAQYKSTYSAKALTSLPLKYSLLFLDSPTTTSSLSNTSSSTCGQH